MIRRLKKGRAHVAVFELIGDVIHVLNLYHTAQDWQNKLAEDFGQQSFPEPLQDPGALVQAPN